MNILYQAIWNINRLDVYSRLRYMLNVIFSLSFIVSEFRLKFTRGRSTTLINAVASHKSSLGTLHLTYDTGAIVRTMMEL